MSFPKFRSKTPKNPTPMVKRRKSLKRKSGGPGSLPQESDLCFDSTFEGAGVPALESHAKVNEFRDTEEKLQEWQQHLEQVK